MKKIMRRHCGQADCTSQGEQDLEVLRLFQPEGMTAWHYELKCPVCNRLSVEVLPRVRARKRVWPYYNDSVGVTFESESHEKGYVKKHGLEPV